MSSALYACVLQRKHCIIWIIIFDFSFFLIQKICVENTLCCHIMYSAYIPHNILLYTSRCCYYYFSSVIQKCCRTNIAPPSLYDLSFSLAQFDWHTMGYIMRVVAQCCLNIYLLKVRFSAQNNNTYPDNKYTHCCSK